MSTDFEVVWEIDMPGKNPEEAAMKALEIMSDPTRSDGYVFSVKDPATQMTCEVDLAMTPGSTTGERRWAPDRTALADLAQWMQDENWDFSEIVEMIRRPHKYAAEFTQMISDRAFDVVAKEPEMEDFEPEPDSTIEAGTRCTVCGHRIQLSDPEDNDSWVHAEDGDWGDHTAEYLLKPV